MGWIPEHNHHHTIECSHEQSTVDCLCVLTGACAMSLVKTILAGIVIWQFISSLLVTMPGPVSIIETGFASSSIGIPRTVFHSWTVLMPASEVYQHFIIMEYFIPGSKPCPEKSKVNLGRKELIRPVAQQEPPKSRSAGNVLVKEQSMFTFNSLFLYFKSVHGIRLLRTDSLSY